MQPMWCSNYNRINLAAFYQLPGAIEPPALKIRGHCAARLRLNISYANEVQERVGCDNSSVLLTHDPKADNSEANSSRLGCCCNWYFYWAGCDYRLTPQALMVWLISGLNLRERRGHFSHVLIATEKDFVRQEEHVFDCCVSDGCRQHAQVRWVLFRNEL